MDLFGIGPLNLIVILGVMLIVFGPERLPEMAAKAGKFLREVRSYASDMTGEFSGEISELREHFDGVQDQVRSFGADLHATSAEVGGAVRDAGSNLASPEPAVTGMNEPPPAVAPSDKVVPFTTAPIRPRIEDYKPGS
jgi:sec-independent protein translocase protein TatB